MPAIPTPAFKNRGMGINKVIIKFLKNISRRALYRSKENCGLKRAGIAMICTWGAPPFNFKPRTLLDSVTPPTELFSRSKAFFAV
jgi:hypothetical protein